MKRVDVRRVKWEVGEVGGGWGCEEDGMEI